MSNDRHKAAEQACASSTIFWLVQVANTAVLLAGPNCKLESILRTSGRWRGFKTRALSSENHCVLPALKLQPGHRSRCKHLNSTVAQRLL